MKIRKNIMIFLVNVAVCCLFANAIGIYIKKREGNLEMEFLDEITKVSQSVNEVFHEDGNEKYIVQVLGGAQEKKLNIGYGGTFDYILVKESFPQEIYDSIVELVDEHKKMYANSLIGGWMYIHFKDDMTVSVELDDEKGNIVSCKYIEDVYSR